MNRFSVRKLVFGALCLALTLVMPFLTGQIPQIGSMLCPMHIPVLLCGFLCGAPWGAAVGLIAPILRSLWLGMPPMFPVAACMAVELAVYGLVAGTLYVRFPRKKPYIYLTLFAAMVLGRLAWGTARFLCTGLNPSAFGFAAFWSGAVATAIPGILVQVVLIPVLVMAMERAHLTAIEK